MTTPLANLRNRERRRAAHAWETMGAMGLSAWLAGYKAAQNDGKRGFTTEEYAAAVAIAREECGDDTDYSNDPQSEDGR